MSLNPCPVLLFMGGCVCVCVRKLYSPHQVMCERLFHECKWWSSEEFVPWRVAYECVYMSLLLLIILCVPWCLTCCVELEYNAISTAAHIRCTHSDTHTLRQQPSGSITHPHIRYSTALCQCHIAIGPVCVCVYKKGRKKAGGPAVSEVGGENAHWKYKSQTARGEGGDVWGKIHIPELASDNLHTCERVNFTINKWLSFLFSLQSSSSRCQNEFAW